jgi:hypothetical protein
MAQPTANATEHTIAWVLNLEADLELADPDGFAPSPRLQELAVQQGRNFLAIAGENTAGVRHVPLERTDAYDACLSWCPTPRAHGAAAARGARLPDAPSITILREVNHRSFAAALGIELPGAGFVRSMPDLDALLAGSSAGEGWLLKRPLGFSGRGRKRVSGPILDGDRRWAEASMEQYGVGLAVEPFVAIEAEFALHGWLGRDGSCLRGQPSRLVCATDGAWLTTRTDGVRLASVEARALRAAFELAAEALLHGGYFGPFAIDAFRWHDARGAHFHPLGEINARYTMGWFVGMGQRRQDWLGRILAAAP